ncbi:hypothetical protein [Hydrogenovibrio marinus]|uniref:Lipoprotein n=1 Tax=Hydrogenovibrio marinus TaxID=28885 RepID=A0A066ZWL0_HYDMR|nr:hypothetical protein [Hydrogenovibrio marinus]KDN94711.1 hypothetical protein EI16_12505 [Hydrogenovibrio marinus]
MKINGLKIAIIWVPLVSCMWVTDANAYGDFSTGKTSDNFRSKTIAEFKKCQRMQNHQAKMECIENARAKFLSYQAEKQKQIFNKMHGNETIQKAFQNRQEILNEIRDKSMQR